MTRTKAFLIVLAASFALGACSTSSTAPPTPTTTHYSGTIASPAVTGTFAATFITTASADVASAVIDQLPVRLPGQRVTEASGTTASITITLISGTVLTLTGSITGGGAFTVSDNATPQDICTGTVASLMNASCTLLGVPNIPMTGFLALASAAGLTTYCGFETPLGSTTPNGSLFLGISGTNSFLARVSSVNDTLSGYLDRTATSSAISDTLVGSTTDFFSGSYSSTLAFGTHMSGGTSIGNWTASSPCALVTALVSGGSAVTFLAVVNTTPANGSVLVSPATVGPITVVIPASAPWLTATVSGTTVTFSAAAQSSTAGSPLTANVLLYPQFAAGAPLTVVVTYNIVAASPPSITADSTALGMTFNMVQGASPPMAHTSNVTVTGGTASGLSAIATPAASWLNLSIAPTSISPGTPALFTATPLAAASSLTPGTYFTTVTIASTVTGVAPIHMGVTLNVVSATTCTITTPTSLFSLNVGTYVNIPFTFIGNCPTFGNYFFAMSPVPSDGLQIQPDIDALSGTPTDVLASATYTLAMISTTGGSPNDTAAKSTLNLIVNPAVPSCVIGPVSPLPPGQVGKDYGQQLEPSINCTQPGDNTALYTWTLAGNVPPGLSFGSGHLTTTGAIVELYGTLSSAIPSGTTYTFTISFDEGQTINGTRITSGAITYMLTVN